MTQAFVENPLVRPATEKWLTKHGYSFQGEVPVPPAGFADYIAQHEDGHRLVAECKSSTNGLGTSIRQVLDYRNTFDPTAQAAIFAPSSWVTPAKVTSCALRGVRLIGLGIKEVDEDQPYNKAAEEAVAALIARKDEWGSLGDEIHLLIGLTVCPSTIRYMAELNEKYGGTLSGAQLDDQGHALIARNIRLLSSGDR